MNAFETIYGCAHGRTLIVNASDVQFFSRIVQSGSFSDAARNLGVTRSAVSKSIARLEQQLGVTLINRSTRKASLTSAGRKFYEHAVEIDAALERAELAVNGSDQRVIGELSVSVPTCLGTVLWPAVLETFSPAWPELGLRLHFNDQPVDLIGGSFDVAIRVTAKLGDSRLLSRRIGTTREVLVASPEYLEKHGTPLDIDQLRDHACLVLGDAASARAAWRFRSGRSYVDVPVTASLTSNTESSLILAACMGNGILRIPELYVRAQLAQGRLRVVLADFSDAAICGIYALYPNRKPPAKVRAFIDFLIEQLPKMDSAEGQDLSAESLPGATRELAKASIR